MKSAVRRVLLLSALMSPNALYALGLGEIHLHSALNQPFDADIDLVSADDEDLSALRASLASNDVFARYGIDKPAYLADFTFRVVRGPDGRDYLKVTSPRPVTEPFVTMLVAADWPRGKLLREYTVLLDPPVFAPSPLAGETPVAAPRAQAPAPAPAPRPEPASPTAAEPERPIRSQPTVVAGSDYRVRTNDTLWKIASEAHPGSRSDVNRAMVAIYQSNPHAFDGNINVLRAGSTLHIPDASAVAAIPAAAAAIEVSRQYQLWRDGTAAGAEASDASAGRLRLVTPDQGSPAASTATTPGTPPATAAGASTAQLQSRVQQLESDLAEARRLLEVKNAELATLQGQAAAGQPGAAAPTPGTTVPAPGEQAPAPGTPAGEAAATPPEVQPTPAAKPAPEVQKPKKPKKPQPQQPKAEEGPSLMERLAGYWWVLLGLLAAGLAFVLYRRSRGEAGAKEMDLEEALARTRTDLRARGPSPGDSSIVVEVRRPGGAPAAKAAPAQRVPESGRKQTSVDDTISGEEPVSVESGDPLAEADFHMAYGLYDQAADLVQLAIKRAPQRRDLKLKLLEIFFVWGNRDRFLDLARDMSGTRNDAQPGEWDKIVIMGKQIAPEDTLFAGERPQASRLDMELHSSAGPLDMDLGADHGSTQGVDFPSEGPKDSVDGGIDFDLGGSPSASDATSIAPTVEITRIDGPRNRSEDPTQEVPIEELGLDIGDTVETGGGEGMFAARRRAAVEDTVESPQLSRTALGEDEDLLSASGILKEQTGILPMLDSTNEVPKIEYGDATGELPTIETARMQARSQEVDFPLGDEPFTMSEVGTKLDLARAYLDMGDPEGARSILDEVLKEGNTEQKQEAERLMASMP